MHSPVVLHGSYKFFIALLTSSSTNTDRQVELSTSKHSDDINVPWRTPSHLNETENSIKHLTSNAPSSTDKIGTLSITVPPTDFIVTNHIIASKSHPQTDNIIGRTTVLSSEHFNISERLSSSVSQATEEISTPHVPLSGTSSISKLEVLSSSEDPTDDNADINQMSISQTMEAMIDTHSMTASTTNIKKLDLTIKPQRNGLTTVTDLVFHARSEKFSDSDTSSPSYVSRAHNHTVACTIEQSNAAKCLNGECFSIETRNNTESNPSFCRYVATERIFNM